MKVLRQIRNSISRSGLLGTIGTCARALVFYAKEQTPARRRRRERWMQSELEFDRTFGVRTAGTIGLANLAISSSNRQYAHGYQATSGVVLGEMLSAVPEDLSDFVFIDFGSGLGRALLIASEYPFRAIRGVEFSPELHKIAVENISSYPSSTQKCRNIESIWQDAAEFMIPDEKAVFYFYNPFLEAVMTRVVQNIEQSLNQNPRSAYIIYYNPEARSVVDVSAAFRLIGETATYCVYRSIVGSSRPENP